MQFWRPPEVLAALISGPINIAQSVATRWFGSFGNRKIDWFWMNPIDFHFVHKILRQT